MTQVADQTFSQPPSPSESPIAATPIDDRPLVAFDFDGTLTVKDTFAAFLIWRASPMRLLIALARLAPSLGRYLVHHDRGRLKAAAIHAALGSIPRTQLALEAEAFADVAIGRLMRPDACAAWAQAREQGFKRVIVTASPEDIIAPFARRLGADVLIGTRLAADRNGRLTGELDGLNCRGPEKLRRLQQAFGPQLRLVAAYGDTAGDREMLAAADVGHMKVFRGRP